MEQSYDITAEEIGRELSQRAYTISCAESCTGGLLTSTLTDVPGSSSYVLGSVVSYSNEVKIHILGVAEETLRTYGAVSPQTAQDMAECIRRLMRADIGVGITGIAGPGGGSTEKPVGLVYIAVADQKKTDVKEYHFLGTRAQIKKSSVQEAFLMIRNRVRGAFA